MLDSPNSRSLRLAAKLDHVQRQPLIGRRSRLLAKSADVGSVDWLASVKGRYLQSVARCSDRTHRQADASCTYQVQRSDERYRALSSEMNH